MNQLFTQTPPFAGRPQNRMINQATQPTMLGPDGQVDMSQLMGYLSSRYPGLTGTQQAGMANTQANTARQMSQGGILGEEAQQTRGLYPPARPMGGTTSRPKSIFS